MRDPPRYVVVSHSVFIASVAVECLFGLVYIWAPFEDDMLQRIFFSVLVLLGASTLTLAAHRTVRGWELPDA